MTFLTNKWWWRRKWCAVRDFFNPRNKWARDAIPNHFSDVDAIFEDVLFNGLIFFWEKDRGEEALRLQYEYPWNEMGPKAVEYQDHNRGVYNAMLEAYNWAKTRKHALETLDYDEDTKHLQNIIKYRKYLWS